MSDIFLSMLKKIGNLLSLKILIRKVVFDVVEEFHTQLYTRYTLFDFETGSIIGTIDIHQKPCPGDLIICDDSLIDSLHFKLEVKKIELNYTGFTGNLYGIKV